MTQGSSSRPEKIGKHSKPYYARSKGFHKYGERYIPKEIKQRIDKDIRALRVPTTEK